MSGRTLQDHGCGLGCSADVEMSSRLVGGGGPRVDTCWMHHHTGLGKTEVPVWETSWDPRRGVRLGAGGVSWHTGHRRPPWPAQSGGKAWWRGPASAPCTLARWGESATGAPARRCPAGRESRLEPRWQFGLTAPSLLVEKTFLLKEHWLLWNSPARTGRDGGLDLAVPKLQPLGLWWASPSPGPRSSPSWAEVSPRCSAVTLWALKRALHQQETGRDSSHQEGGDAVNHTTRSSAEHVRLDTRVHAYPYICDLRQPEWGLSSVLFSFLHPYTGAPWWRDSLSGGWAAVTAERRASLSLRLQDPASGSSAPWPACFP